MTTQYAVLSARSGRSYTAKLFTVADPDTEVTGSTITVTERTNAKGMFRAGIARASALPAGDYILVYLYGTIGAAIGYFTFAGTDGETATETPVTAELDSASVTAVQSGLALETTSQSIKAKTDNLPADPADQSAVEAAITAATSPLATPAQVNAQVVDALSVDTYAELTAPPAATSSLKDKITWLFMYARNKVTQTATQRKLYRDDGSTVAGTSGTTDDGTTFTKGEDA